MSVSTDPFAPYRGLPTLSPRQAATVLGTTEDTIWRQAKLGTLPFPVLKIGRRFRIPTAPLLRILEGEVPVS